MAKEKKSGTRRSVVLLKDLAPREDIKGGSAKVLFGQSVEAPQNRSRPSTPSSFNKKRP